ncbi:hypothetical protein ACLOJK_022736 [Asimina triloba]
MPNQVSVHVTKRYTHSPQDSGVRIRRDTVSASSHLQNISPFCICSSPHPHLLSSQILMAASDIRILLALSSLLLLLLSVPPASVAAKKSADVTDLQIGVKVLVFYASADQVDFATASGCLDPSNPLKFGSFSIFLIAFASWWLGASCSSGTLQAVFIVCHSLQEVFLKLDHG